jgi:hypothetical protein
MSVDRSVTSSSSQVLVLAVRDVKVSLGITVLLCETEIDNVDLVSTFTDTHEEVVGFDISVNEVSRVNVFDSRDLCGKE